MKLLHTMLRVRDLQKSIEFYTGTIGMELVRTIERPEQKYSLAFIGFGGGNANGEAEVELTYNHGDFEYDVGTGYGHLAFGVDDVAATCERVRASEGTVTREPGPVKGGETVIAFVEDPDHYKIELVESATREL